MKRIAFIFIWILVFSIPWQNVVTIPGLGTFTRFIGFGAIGVAGLYILIKQQVKEPPLLLLVMGLFVIWSFLTYFWSINPGATIGRTVTYIQLLAMVWLIWELCDSKREIYSIMQAYILGAYVALIDMIITFVTSPAGGMRIAARGFDQNEMATTLALGIPIAWYLFLQQQRGVFSWVNMLYILTSLFGIVLTASRGGILVAAVALLIIPLTLFDLTKRSRYLVTTFLVIIVAIGTFYLPGIYPKLEENIVRLQETPGEIREGTLTNRRVIWAAGMQVYKEHPIVGVGAHGFRLAVQGMPAGSSTGVRADYFYSPRAPHNTFLSVLVDTGLIGFCIFLLMFIIALIPVFYLNPLHKKFYSILFLALIVGLFPLGWEYAKATWYVLSLNIMYAAFVFRQMNLTIVKR